MQICNLPVFVPVSGGGLRRERSFCMSPLRLLSRILDRRRRRRRRPNVTSGAVIEFSVLVPVTIRLPSKSKFVSSPARRVIGENETNGCSVRE